jgi:hypothetical protein
MTPRVSMSGSLDGSAKVSMGFTIALRFDGAARVLERNERQVVRPIWVSSAFVTPVFSRVALFPFVLTHPFSFTAPVVVD